MHGTTEGIQRESGRGMSILIRRPGSQAQEMHVARIGNYGLGGKVESVGEKGEVSYSRLKRRWWHLSIRANFQTASFIDRQQDDPIKRSGYVKFATEDDRKLQ